MRENGIGYQPVGFTIVVRIVVTIALPILHFPNFLFTVARYARSPFFFFFTGPCGMRVELRAVMVMVCVCVCKEEEGC